MHSQLGALAPRVKNTIHWLEHEPSALGVVAQVDKLSNGVWRLNISKNHMGIKGESLRAFNGGQEACLLVGGDEMLDIAIGRKKKRHKYLPFPN